MQQVLELLAFMAIPLLITAILSIELESSMNLPIMTNDCTCHTRAADEAHLLCESCHQAQTEELEVELELQRNKPETHRPIEEDENQFINNSMQRWADRRFK